MKLILASRSAKLATLFYLTAILFFFIPAAKAAENISGEILSDTTWSGNINITGNTTIGAGVSVLVTKGSKIEMGSFKLIINGILNLKGTRSEPIFVGGSGYTISAQWGGKLIVSNADISGGGKYPSLCYSCDFAPEITSAVEVRRGYLEMERAMIHDNMIGVMVDNDSKEDFFVHLSNFSGNLEKDVKAKYNNALWYDFRYNWWGNASGPPKDKLNPDQYEKIVGNVDVAAWLENENTPNPVVVVPGFFGSQEKNGVWQMDPILHVYDNLYNAFARNGFSAEKNLFAFPYDWKNDINQNSILLREKIQEIKAQTKMPKVDLVAHSMGGLVARAYIESESYQNDIGQLITLGTPNNGLVEIYPMWEAGRTVGVGQGVMKKIMESEAKENGYTDFFEYIHKKPILSVPQLLPNYEYLMDVDKNGPLIYPKDYPKNDFLDDLNSSEKKQRLDNIFYTKITGNVDSKISTIIGFNVVKVNMGEKWLHGYPLSFEIPLVGHRGSFNGEGDGTVPITSSKSENIPADDYLELNSGHQNLPTDAQDIVLKTLTGKDPKIAVTNSLIENILFIGVFSPVDIQVISPSGKIVGKDFSKEKEINEIPGAYYSGFNTKTEFITIDNPESGQYRIIARGTGEGDFKIEATNIENSKEATDEVGISFTGQTSLDQNNEFVFSLAGNAISSGEEEKKQEEENLENRKNAPEESVFAFSSDEKIDRKDTDKKKNSKKGQEIEKIFPKKAFNFGNIIKAKNPQEILKNSIENEFEKKALQVAGAETENIAKNAISDSKKSPLNFLRILIFVAILLSSLFFGKKLIKFF